SSHVIGKDPSQFVSQLTGRLLLHQDVSWIGKFIRQLGDSAPAPWIAPLHSCLEPPGGALIRTLKGHSGSVNGVALSGDGWLAISASDDTTLKVWEVESGCELRTLQGHSWGVNQVTLSGDGRLAISASEDKTLKVWEVESGRELRTLQGHSGYVAGVTVSEDG